MLIWFKNKKQKQAKKISCSEFALLRTSFKGILNTRSVLLCTITVVLRKDI